MPNTARIEGHLIGPGANKPSILSFTCPICGSDTLAEVWHGVFESICIGGLVPGKGALFKGTMYDNEQAEFKGYHCANCSYALVSPEGKVIRSEEELVRLLEILSGNNEAAKEYRRQSEVRSTEPAPKYCPECDRQFDRIDD
jgi:hypothetical protein